MLLECSTEISGGESCQFSFCSPVQSSSSEQLIYLLYPEPWLRLHVVAREYFAALEPMILLQTYVKSICLSLDFNLVKSSALILPGRSGEVFSLCSRRDPFPQTSRPFYSFSLLRVCKNLGSGHVNSPRKQTPHAVRHRNMNSLKTCYKLAMTLYPTPKTCLSPRKQIHHPS